MNRVISRTNIVILATTLQLAVSYGQSLPDQPGTSPAANPFGQTTATPQTRTEVPANSYPGPAGEYANALDAFTGTFYPSQGTPRAGGRALVVRSSEGEVGRDLEMDLTVMSHILGNVVREEAGVSARPQTAMGIDVYFPADGNGIRSLYLEGYGALFLFHVDFPLLAAPKESIEQKEKEATDSTWEEAKREVYGGPAEEHLEKVADEFNEEKVAKLKTALTEALKNAKNIRGLDSGNFVTICVSGRSNGPRRNRMLGQVYSAGGAGGANTGISRNWFGRMGGASSDSEPGTFLTVRARKADIDAFAGGRMTMEEFRGKVSAVSYSIGGGSETAATHKPALR